MGLVPILETPGELPWRRASREPASGPGCIGTGMLRPGGAREARPGGSRAMKEATCILSAIERGETHAAEELLPLVYDELRSLAARWLSQEKPGQTLQATGLVHEAYVRLVDTDAIQRW